MRSTHGHASNTSLADTLNSRSPFPSPPAGSMYVGRSSLNAWKRMSRVFVWERCGESSRSAQRTSLCRKVASVHERQRAGHCWEEQVDLRRGAFIVRHRPREAVSETNGPQTKGPFKGYHSAHLERPTKTFPQRKSGGREVWHFFF